MLLDWYIRFRRIDEWPEAQATAISTDFVAGVGDSEGRGLDGKRIEFSYQGTDGLHYRGSALAMENTDLFYVVVGDSFRVRINPRNPGRYFVPGAHSPERWFANTLAFFVLLAAGAVWLIIRIAHK